MTVAASWIADSQSPDQRLPYGFSVSISYHVFVETFLSPSAKIDYPMLRKPGRRRFDLFSVLLTVLAIGMSLTLAYQISVYYTGDAAPMAKQSPARPVVGG